MNWAHFCDENEVLLTQLKPLLVKLHAGEIPGIWVGEDTAGFGDMRLRWVIYPAVTDQGLGFRFSTVNMNPASDIYDSRAYIYLIGEVIDEKESNLFSTAIRRAREIEWEKRNRCEESGDWSEADADCFVAVTDEEKEALLEKCKDHQMRESPQPDPLISRILSYRKIQNDPLISRGLSYPRIQNN